MPDSTTDDLRIGSFRPLISPAILAEQLPLPAQSAENIGAYRRTIADILAGRDSRVVAIVGPCSVHDPSALVDFARQLHAETAHLRDAIFPVLRVYFEKPRTVVGWKGLISDPDLNGSFRINHGLYLAREVLLNVAAIGLPAASEFLDTTFGQYYADLVSFGAIGARTVESQIHRELASGLSMPVGFKNGTSGHADVAIDAIRSARHSHWFPSLTKLGSPAILKSTGNPDGHVIHRGGKLTGPNYKSPHIRATAEALAAHDLPETVIVDCSHGNSDKDPQRQKAVLADVASQIAAGEQAIRGIMMESHLVGGRQALGDGTGLVYGQSVTDACLDLSETLPLIETLAAAVRERAVRERRGAP